DKNSRGPASAPPAREGGRPFSPFRQSAPRAGRPHAARALCGTAALVAAGRRAAKAPVRPDRAILKCKCIDFIIKFFTLQPSWVLHTTRETVTIDSGPNSDNLPKGVSQQNVFLYGFQAFGVPPGAVQCRARPGASDRRIKIRRSKPCLTM